MADIRRFFNTSVMAMDLFDLSTGQLISEGSTRTVYKYNPDPTKVIKFETSAKRFQNVMEYETWEIVKHTKYAEWFAPCYTISDCGVILIQSFARDLEDSELVENIPAFFADVKRENFGMFNGHIVCRDYGNHWLIDRGLSSKMKKAEW